MTGSPTDGHSSDNTPPSPPAPQVSLDAKVTFLSQPRAYPDHPSHVQRVQTHMAWVFLTDRHAWKLKKPVRYEFLDFSTLEARYADSQREVQLNRRLAPDVYLGVVPLRIDGNRRMFLGDDREGEPIDWLVKMRRLPAQHMLDERIRTGTVNEARVRRLAERLTEFYTHESAVEMSPEGYRARFEREIRDDRRALLEPRFELPGETVETAVGALLETLREQPQMFDERVKQGRIIEAHGDLRPQHVCMTEPAPVIIDCLEFNADFRQLDPLDELAYFSLECERLGAGWVGGRTLAIYQEAVGDYPPKQLLDFYTRRRALLRAKLAIWHTADDTVDHHDQWARRALTYLDRALPQSRPQPEGNSQRSKP